ncbi:MAG: hypothetical protein HXX08_11140 [Chloroflexi bacterium]|uniref:Uncharacterized protein n=1 Tax=Candidatus Chlorohelix allophototropha TaxID=3003348 RepID=A0A8T7LZA8_9CHLR|nr:hypothetical protein [Chloroflexota bacterium]WJW65791.1 hypothetical protein OZ401_001570 [Chloroflexota bacterium L227-S17]
MSYETYKTEYTKLNDELIAAADELRAAEKVLSDNPLDFTYEQFAARNSADKKCRNIKFSMRVLREAHPSLEKKRQYEKQYGHITYAHTVMVDEVVVKTERLDCFGKVIK